MSFRVGGIYKDGRGCNYIVVTYGAQLGLYFLHHDPRRLPEKPWVSIYHNLDGTYGKGGIDRYTLLPQEYKWVDGEGLIAIGTLPQGNVSTDAQAMDTLIPGDAHLDSKARATDIWKDKYRKPIPVPEKVVFEQFKPGVKEDGTLDPWVISRSGAAPPDDVAHTLQHPLQREGDYNDPRHGSSGMFYGSTS